jgi:GTPase SAR1 family protein
LLKFQLDLKNTKPLQQRKPNNSSITCSHYRKSVGALLFFDLTDRLTFEHTIDWLAEIHDHTEDDITIMLVGNKVDLVQESPESRKISESEAKSFAEKNNLLYSETSAKNGFNVKEAFENLVESKYKEVCLIILAIYEQQKIKKATGESSNDQDEAKIKSKILKNFNKDSSTTNLEEKKASNDSCCS